MEKRRRAAIAHLRKRLPGAICLVYATYNALAVGFGPTAKGSALPITVALYPRWATLFLMFGATLDDPRSTSPKPSKTLSGATKGWPRAD